MGGSIKTFLQAKKNNYILQIRVALGAKTGIWINKRLCKEDKDVSIRVRTKGGLQIYTMPLVEKKPNMSKRLRETSKGGTMILRGGPVNVSEAIDCIKKAMKGGTLTFDELRALVTEPSISESEKDQEEGATLENVVLILPIDKVTGKCPQIDDEAYDSRNNSKRQ